MNGTIILSKWLGGKSRICKQLIELLPEHHCYVEPFGGMASVLLNKPASAVEVYNDLNGQIATLFMVLKFHPDELARELQGLVISRQLFEHFKSHAGLTDIQRAARLLYALEYGFGGQGQHFGTSTHKSAISVQAVIGRADLVATRFTRVVVENLDWEDCLARYDSPQTVFFCDPPYWGTAGYAVPFSERDQIVLADRLRAIQGKFVMTNSDARFVRGLYRGLPMRTLKSKLTAGSSNSSTLSHLVVTNFDHRAGSVRGGG
ncbi:DNA adenine methylase [Candidatus Nitronereus thalassa]|uniref:site-specific DNA-methyltransferase (adenine-specific) n=1 Tax=Candidatus Nitronereus thalassa TaxID=3020898 RepID=A0ABU3K3A4_9BACT|nr:DNA adenine methylase [Candidatus Nitronereus thalassa]MDT7040864.1 DNA adenine methylase [Candidatus Nitronereus thalassa]